MISGEGGTATLPDGTRGALLRAYDKKTGAVFYDSDGKGGHAAVQIATLQKNLKGFSNLDFFVV